MKRIMESTPEQIIAAEDLKHMQNTCRVRPAAIQQWESEQNTGLTTVIATKPFRSMHNSHVLFWKYGNK